MDFRNFWRSYICLNFAYFFKEVSSIRLVIVNYLEKFWETFQIFYVIKLSLSTIPIIMYGIMYFYILVEIYFWWNWRNFSFMGCLVILAKPINKYICTTFSLLSLLNQLTHHFLLHQVLLIYKGFYMPNLLNRVIVWTNFERLNIISKKYKLIFMLKYFEALHVDSKNSATFGGLRRCIVITNIYFN